MTTQYLTAKLSILPRLFSPTLDAIFSTLPFTLRWRTLLLQPINNLAAILTSPQWLFNNEYSVIYIPTRSGSKRCLVSQPPTSNQQTKHSGSQNGKILRPLHIDIHGGGWIGGFAEQGSRLNALIAHETGAVVVSITYRIAPRYIYPAAHDDVDDIVDWLIAHAYTFGADAQLMTISGGSVGASLGVGICQHLYHLKQQQTTTDRNGRKEIPRPLAFLGICPALDFRQSPDEKPRPVGYPTFDPLAFLVKLFDVYAGVERDKNICDARLHSALAPVEAFPDDVLIVAAGIDVLLHEALVFVERVKSDERKRVECMVVEKGFHGFVELPSFILQQERLEVFDRTIKFIRSAHKRAGFDIDII